MSRSEKLKHLRLPSNFPSVANFYFGSQSGTAEKFCQQLEEEAQQLFVFDKTQVLSFEDTDYSKFGKSADEMTIICVATHYEGDPCDNTAEFYKWIKELKRNNENKSLNDLNYVVFGLGDTAYEHFNAMGKYFDKVFEELGGTRLAVAGVGNSQNLTTEDEFEEWKKGLWHRISVHYTKINPNNG